MALAHVPCKVRQDYCTQFEGKSAGFRTGKGEFVP